MTARLANPSLRWIASYLAAVLSGTVLATLGTYAVAGQEGALVSSASAAGQLLLFVTGMLFLPVAAGTFLLHRAGYWTYPGFAVMGAAIPALFFGVLAFLTPAEGRGAAFLPMTLLMMLTWAAGGAVFLAVWKRLS